MGNHRGAYVADQPGPQDPTGDSCLLEPGPAAYEPVMAASGGDLRGPSGNRPSSQPALPPPKQTL